jgi:PAS domain-containing protein
MVAFSGELFDAADLGFAVYHLEDAADPMSLTLVEMNEASERTMRVGRSEVLGKRIAEAFPGAYAAMSAEVFAGVIREGTTVEIGDITYSDERVGESIYCVKAVPLPDDCVGIIHVNVTEQRKNEHGLRRIQADFQRVAETTSEGLIIADTKELLRQ